MNRLSVTAHDLGMCDVSCACKRGGLGYDPNAPMSVASQPMDPELKQKLVYTGIALLIAAGGYAYYRYKVASTQYRLAKYVGHTGAKVLLSGYDKAKAKIAAASERVSSDYKKAHERVTGDYKKASKAVKGAKVPKLALKLGVEKG